MRRTLLALPLALALAAGEARAQWSIEGRAIAGRVEHRVDAGFGVGASTGTTLGAEALARIGGTFEVAAHAMGGSLAADSLAHDDRTMGEIGARAGMLVMPWLVVQATATVRTYDLAPARQRWTQLGAGAELRMDFVGGGLRSIVRATLLPHVAVSGMPGPDFGVAGAAGLELTQRRLVGGLEYGIERYAFPSDAAGTRRREQLGSLLLRLGARW